MKHQLSFTLSPWTLLLMLEQDQCLQPTLEHHSCRQTRAEPEAATQRTLGLLFPCKAKPRGQLCSMERISPRHPLGAQEVWFQKRQIPGALQGGPPVFSTASLATSKGSWPSLFPARRNKSLRNFS